MANLEARNHVERVLSVARNEATVVGEPGIASSWRRCLVDHKLDPARRGPPRTLTQSELPRHAEPIDGLIHLATPELEDLYRALRGTGYCVNLADINAASCSRAARRRRSSGGSPGPTCRRCWRWRSGRTR